ncbi:MAG: 5-formyltetrahydrofolate cyclo-ligase, partial [Rhodobacteraceae bacterium]|nr:5-formyltetrahydrofolate cyclo-ligase [Paracoccaceae bacterium]
MADKAALRTTSRKTRGRLDHQALSVVISREFVRLVRERFMGASIAGYCAIGTEMNPYDAMVECHAMGCKLCVPVIRKSEKKLVFGHWTPAMDMVIGQFGIAEPVVLDQQVPDVIVLPLLAYDGEGRRLGYGGGYYDRALAELRAVGQVWAIGFAAGGQMVDALPCDMHDQPLDMVVT